ncbi:hypothetical protein RIF29_34240 [Crotalaria pallida]|uniref:Uncharacterized protein n=1 Tax=Crotalaria pallida TaxID=3830 RepID=A0AAN9HR54_CROPI
MVMYHVLRLGSWKYQTLLNSASISKGYNGGPLMNKKWDDQFKSSSCHEGSHQLISELNPKLRLLKDAVAKSNNDGINVDATQTVDTIVGEKVSNAIGETSPDGDITSKPNVVLDSTVANIQQEGCNEEQPWTPIRTRSKAQIRHEQNQASYFLDIVKDVWQVDILGYAMYRVGAKLKMLKEPLKQLNRTDFSDIGIKEKQMRQALDEVQTRLRSNPQDAEV